MNAFREIAREIKGFLNTPHDPVGVQILEGTERGNPPATPQRFCILEREDWAGAEHVFHFGDLECPGAARALGMTQPQYVEVEPRIHRPVVAVRVGPLEEVDVVLFTVTPRQAMVLAILTGGIEAHCTRHSLRSHCFDLRRMAGVRMGQTPLAANVSCGTMEAR